MLSVGPLDASTDDRFLFEAAMMAKGLEERIDGRDDGLDQNLQLLATRSDSIEQEKQTMLEWEERKGRRPYMRCVDGPRGSSIASRRDR